jgi:hypothetical protein
MPSFLVRFLHIFNLLLMSTLEDSNYNSTITLPVLWLVYLMISEHISEENVIFEVVFPR